MTLLRQQMIDTMQQRGISVRTHETYLAAVRDLARYYHTRHWEVSRISATTAMVSSPCIMAVGTGIAQQAAACQPDGRLSSTDIYLPCCAPQINA